MSEGAGKRGAFSLDGEHVLITGGGTGLGRAAAASAVEAGATVTLVGRRREPLEAACDELGGRTGYAVGDITAEESRRSLVAEAVEGRGTVTVLVNNAGIHLKQPLVSMEIADLRSVIETHVTAGIALSQLLVPGMTDRGAGTVIFMGSMTSFIGMPNVVAYSAAKAAVGGVVRSLAVELASQGVRVNGIAPGWIESPMLRRALAGDAEREARILARTPAGRFGAGEDIGRAVVYLASDAGRFVNGVMLPVDGGALIGF